MAERWTLDEVPGQGPPDIPVYILTSRRSFSAAGSYDPRTGKTWEVEGITPDLEVNPEQALQAAIGHFRGWRR